MAKLLPHHRWKARAKGLQPFHRAAKTVIDPVDPVDPIDPPVEPPTEPVDPFLAYYGPNGEVPGIILDFDAGVYGADTGAGLSAIDPAALITNYGGLVDLGDGVQRMTTATAPTIALTAFAFDTTKGTVAVRFRFGVMPDYGTPVYINNNGASGRIGVWKNPDNSWRYVVRTASTYQVALNGALHVDNASEGHAFAWQANDFGVSFDGTPVLVDTAGTIPALTRMDLGNDRGNVILPGGIERLVYYPERLPNAALETLSGTAGPSTLTIAGDQGYTQTRVNDNIYEVIDASTATFRLNNVGTDPNYQPYPMFIDGSVVPRVTLKGGTVLGEVNPAFSWEQGYNQANDPNGNATAIYLRDAVATVTDWTIGSPTADAHVWDVFRASDACANSIVKDSNVYGWRDDLIEADACQGNITAQNIFADGGFAAFSMTGVHTGHTFTITNCAVRLTTRFVYKGEQMHGPTFKVESSGTAQPNWVVNDTVIAIEAPLYEGADTRTPLAFAKMTGTGNKWLVLGGTMHPDHPPLPAGWTLFEGQAAIDEWEAVKAARGIGV